MADVLNADDFKFVKDAEERDKILWNAAIEEAAKMVDKADNWLHGDKIRSLKK